MNKHFAVAAALAVAAVAGVAVAIIATTASSRHTALPMQSPAASPLAPPVAPLAAVPGASPAVAASVTGPAQPPLPAQPSAKNEDPPTGPAAGGAASSATRFIDCWFAIPSGRAARCGALTVPESAGRPGGRMLTLRFVIFGSPGSPLPPLLFISGGPGEPAGIDGDGISEWWDLLDGAAWARGRAVIVFDQRGTGVSEPDLRCPEMVDAGTHLLLDSAGPDKGADEAAIWAAAAGRCHDRLSRAGIDLAAYNTETTLADIEALMSGLRYPAWDLLAVSYGTRVALGLMREPPAGLRAVILDSVYPPQVAAYAEAAGAAETALRDLVAHCAADAACRRANPDLAGSLETLLRRAAGQPLRVQLATGSAAGQTIALDDARLVETLFYGFYRPRDLAAMPGIVGAAAQGDVTPLRPLVEEAVATYASPKTSHGLYLSVSCHDEYPFEPVAEIRRAAAGGSAEGAATRRFARDELALAACPAWPVGAAPAATRDPVRSDLPVLLLAGDLDPVTPPRWAKLASAGLPRAKLFHFAGVGHGVLAAEPCADRLAAAFLADPGKPPYDECLLGLQR